MPHKLVNGRAADHHPEGPLQTVSYAVTLVGLGALGSQICLELTRASSPAIKRVSLIDPDTVQAHNVAACEAWSTIVSKIGRQVIGNYKSVCMAQYLSQWAPHIAWTSRPCEVADIGWGDLAESDVIITATDSVLSRMETAYAARMLRKPMLDAGVVGRGRVGGRCASFTPHADSACYSCGLSTGTRAALLEHLASRSLSCAALPLTESMGSSREGSASVQAVAQCVVHQLAQVFHENRSHAWRMQDGAIDAVELSVSSECPWHHSPDLMALEDDRPIREALSEDNVLLLPWPMALTARCDTCGMQVEGPIRLARLRSGLRCTHCNGRSMQPGRVVERICREDDVAERTPSQLGLPKRNVLPVRKRIQTQRTS